MLRFRDKAILVVLSLCAVGAFLFWLGAAYLATTEEVPEYGGRYVEGIVGQPRYVNPILSSVNAVDEDLVSVIYSGILGYDADGKLENRLAETVEVSSDGLTYVVRLREGATWHDGEAVTVGDVAFTVGAIKDPAYRSPLRQAWQGVAVETRDDRTIAFILSKPYTGFREYLTVGILPKHVWASVPPDRFALADANLSPIGSGPYRFGSLKKDADGNILSCELRSFPGHVDGEPYITRLDFSFYPDEEAMVSAYEKKEIMGMSMISSAQGEGFVGRKGTAVHPFHLPRMFAVFLNPVKSVPLGYDEVRQALSMATDRDALVRDVLAGRGIATPLPFLPFMEGNPSASPVSFDVGGANALLEEKGWTKGDDGIRKKDDARIAFTLLVPDWPEVKLTAELLRAQWREIGADVSVDVMPFIDLNRDRIRPREYEALLYGEDIRVNPDFYSFWHSSEKGDSGLNYAMFEDKDADSALESLRGEADPAKRDELLSAFLGILSRRNPAVFLYSPDGFSIMSDAVRGWDIQIVNRPPSRFSGIGTWYIETKRIWSRG